MTNNLREKFEEIIDQNKARILRICKSYGQTPEDREDMFQEVALNIWKSLPSFHGEAIIANFSWYSRHVCQANDFYNDGFIFNFCNHVLHCNYLVE